MSAWIKISRGSYGTCLVLKLFGRTFSVTLSTFR